ncbi:hypothetical protein LshimejAT787_0403580 [Lyophyllum shimeji]|uniref:Distal membrane-arm assembly complex protein 1-like domain-containing protein n=1 Tax=Lyophyllum shimeji TaxID=47721 RepID=A0A9P3PL51_LYOSH|nr:hypothetical protein LshimejAT787_0403580 [Lyophyllum shimeji]
MDRLVPSASNGKRRRIVLDVMLFPMDLRSDHVALHHTTTMPDAQDAAVIPKAAPVRQEDLPNKDCLSCRLIGTGALTGVGSYALWQSRVAAPGSPGQKRILAGLGLAFLAGGVMRWFK